MSTVAPRKGTMVGRIVRGHDREGEAIALWSAVIGLATAILVAAVTGRFLLGQHASAATIMGDLGFLLAIFAPFATALVSSVVPVAARRSIWLAAGVLALVLGGLTFASGVGWLFAVADGGFVWAWWRTRDTAGLFGAPRSIAVTGWLVLWFGGALWATSLRTTPACWNDSGSNPGWVAARSSDDCVSDIIDDREGLLALAGVTISLVGLALMAQGYDAPVA